jgi:uncharacterized protein YecE (DUF72 family)
MSPQLDLFGDPEKDELERIAGAIPSHVRFGTTSWTFEGWKGIVYRESYANKKEFVQRSLAEYARFPLFRTVGFDRSYYAPMTSEELRAYAEQLPPGFRCCIKVWSEITTRVFPEHPRFGDRAGRANYSFLDVSLFEDRVAAPLAEAFADHTGPLVMELTPSPGRQTDPKALADAIEAFLSRAPAHFSYAFELRERHLLSKRYLDVLRAFPHASHVLNFHTVMPPLGEQIDRGVPLDGNVVARLLVPPGKTYEELERAYSPFHRLVKVEAGMRTDVLRLIAETASSATLYVLANNKAEGSSPLTIRALAMMLDSKSVAKS